MSFRLQELSQALSQNQIASSNLSVLKDYGKDWLKQWDGQAGLVLFPKKTQEVLFIVQWAKKHDYCLIPSGGRTGLSGGSTALHKEVVVSFDKMNQIIDFNPFEKTVTVEAGSITKTIQDFAKSKNLYFPISFASEGSSQIGGNVATNAGGIHVLRYGNIRNYILGLEVVTGRGDVLNLGRGLIKNATGYDLKHLFIGSEGTLGLITKVVLKLLNPPNKPQTFLLAVKKQEHILDLFKSFNSKIQPLAFEVFSDKALDYVLSHGDIDFPLEHRHPFYILMEIEARHQDTALFLFEKALKDEYIQDGTLSQNFQQSQSLWKLRENISESISSYHPYKNDICVRTSKMSNFINEMNLILEKSYPDFPVVWFGHFGDGNLHINILKPKDLDKKDFIKECEKVNEILFSLVQKFEGTISAEHGVGLLKKAYLPYSCSQEEIYNMKQIKKVFDPQSILNKGKIFDL